MRVTVPVELFPPTIVPGDLVSDERVAAFTVSVAWALLPPRLALITEVVFAVTLSVAVLKTVDELPAGTITVAGTVAAAVLLLVSVTEAPPAGAAVFSWTVPVELFPPTTVVGVRDTDETPSEGVIVRGALAVAP